jgi:hypothetical protein
MRRVLSALLVLVGLQGFKLTTVRIGKETVRGLSDDV